MHDAGHVKLNRMDKRSQMACLKECGRLLGLGCSVLFFPEGTRSKDGKMAAFKKVSSTHRTSFVVSFPFVSRMCSSECIPVKVSVLAAWLCTHVINTVTNHYQVPVFLIVLYGLPAAVALPC